MKRLGLAIGLMLIGSVAYAQTQTTQQEEGAAAPAAEEATTPEAAASEASTPAVEEPAPFSGSIQVDVWADDWFRLWANGEEMKEDSTPASIEDAPNTDTFTFKAELPVVVALEFRDFMQNETGLKFIGTEKQQVGAGGAIAQFRDAETGALLKVTDSSFRCMVVHRAPLDEMCASDDNPRVGRGNCDQQITTFQPTWMSPEIDDSSWPQATVHTSGDVKPRGDYDSISWDQSAQFIWGPSLVKDNIVLCRATIE